MRKPHRMVVFMLFVILAVTTLGSDFPHAGWFVLVAGVVMAAAVLAVEKLKSATS